MKSTTVFHNGKNLLIGALFAFTMISMQGCYEKVNTPTVEKSSLGIGKCGTGMQGKCGTGKCGAALKADGMKCGTGKCGTTEKAAGN